MSDTAGTLYMLAFTPAIIMQFEINWETTYEKKQHGQDFH